MPKVKNTIKEVNRNRRYGRRCLGKGIFIDNDSKSTGLNNHDLVIAGSRGGKTGSVVYPQLKMAGDCSLIVTDTKRILHRMFRKELEDKGYKVLVLDFVEPDKSCMYNPLDYIRVNNDGSYNEMDIVRLSTALVSDNLDRDHFWIMQARTFLEFFLSYCLEALPEEDHIMDTVCRLYRTFTSTDMGEAGFIDWIENNPDSFAAKRYAAIKGIENSEKTLSCIYGFVNCSLYPFDIRALHHIFGWPLPWNKPIDLDEIEQIVYPYYEDMDTDDLAETSDEAANEINTVDNDYLDIADLGKQKMVLFLNISDTDRSMDNVVNLFYTQVLQTLVAEADKQDNGELRMPVRIIFDDFAGGTPISDFDKIISCVGSRDIWLTMCVQSLSQLVSLYSESQARTIRDNCDHILYFGSNDPGTADYISLRAGKTPETILSMPRDKEYYMESGKRAVLIDKVIPYSFESENNL